MYMMYNVYIYIYTSMCINVAVEIVDICQQTLRKRSSKATPTTARSALLPLDNLNCPCRHGKPHPLTPPTPTPRNLAPGKGKETGERGGRERERPCCSDYLEVLFGGRKLTTNATCTFTHLEDTSGQSFSIFPALGVFSVCLFFPFFSLHLTSIITKVCNT